MSDQDPRVQRDFVVARHRETAIERVNAAAEGLTFAVTEEPAQDSSMLTELKACFESVAFATFDIAGFTHELRLALQSTSSGGWGLIDGYATALLASPAMRDALPELAIDRHVQQPALVPDTFGSLDPLLLDGSLAVALRNGGPYRRVPAGHALTLAREFRQDLFGDRFDDIHVAIGSGWSAWFHDEGWDHAWIITDYRDTRTHILCVSGND